MTLLVTSGSRSPAVGAVTSSWLALAAAKGPGPAAMVNLWPAPAAKGQGLAAMAGPWLALVGRGLGPAAMAGPCRPPAAEAVRQLGHHLLLRVEERQRALHRDLLLVAEGALRPSLLLLLLLHTPSWC